MHLDTISIYGVYFENTKYNAYHQHLEKLLHCLVALVPTAELSFFHQAAANEINQIRHRTRRSQGCQFQSPSTTTHKGGVDGGQNGPRDAHCGQGCSETKQLESAAWWDLEIQLEWLVVGSSSTL